jgi:hypothetical protein
MLRWKLDVCCGKNPTDQSHIFLKFMWLEKSGQTEVVIVDGVGESCVASVKGTLRSCMEKQRILLMYRKKA